jgi:hypothetical protein
MPRLTINFQNNIIYKIVSIDDKTIYMGSTTEFSKTKSRLKDIASKPVISKGKYAKLWTDVHDAGGWGKVVMLEVKKYPCMDAREAEAEVFRLQQQIRMEQLNIQFKADEEKISKHENVPFKHQVVKKTTLNYKY